MATLNYTAAQIGALLAKADTSVQPATTGDLDNLATSTKTNLVAAINETFQSVSDGKTLIAAAITDKGVATAATDSFSTMATNIAAIPTGGAAEVEQKDVNFIDYDGTILYSYSAADFLNLSAMPNNPSHTGLTARGWNWDLNDAKTYVQLNGGLWIGQTYYDANGATEIDIELQTGRLEPYLRLSVNGTVSIDWGDGSTADTLTGTSLTTVLNKKHTYSAAGAYTIKITPTSGTIRLNAGYNNAILSKNSGTGSLNRIYAAAIKAVRIGTSVDAIGTYAFYYACHLLAMVVPSGVGLSSGYAFQYSNIQKISLPKGVTFGTYTFADATSLYGISLPSGVSTIPNSFCYDCCSLVKIVIPSEISSLGTSAFSSCYGLAEIHFKGTTPPTLTNSNTFSSLPTDCIIYVPTGKLNDYKTASYYPDPNTYTYVEE